MEVDMNVFSLEEQDKIRGDRREVCRDLKAAGRDEFCRVWGKE